MFELALQILAAAAAATDAAAKSKQAYEKVRLSLQQTHELTDAQSAELDRRAEAIFASPASQPSGR